MKKLILLAIWSTAFSSVLGQNIKNERVDVKYLRAPYSPLKKDIKTYRKNIEVIGFSLTDMLSDPKKQLEPALNLNGYELVQSGGDLEVYARLEAFTAENTHVSSEERSETKSDKTVVKYKVYIGSTQMKYPIFLKLYDIKADQIIFQGYVDNSDQPVSEQTSEFRSYSDASNAINSVVSDGKRNLLSKNLSKLRSKIENAFTFYPTEDRWWINYVSTSKKVNYDDVVAAKDSTKAALESMTNNTYEISETSKERLSQAIKMWTIILEGSDPQDRKARIDKKVTVAVMENLAFCNFFLRHYTEAANWIAQAKALDKQGWQSILEEKIQDSKTRLSANEIAFF